MPVAAHAKLGDLLAALITQVNSLTTDIASLVIAAGTGIANAATLAIFGASSPTVKSTTAFVALIGGVGVFKPASTSMPALAGVLATAKSAAWAFYVNAAGVLSVSAKTADSADAPTAHSLIPATPIGLALIGYVTITNTSGSNFTGGTTNLDAGGISVSYINAAIGMPDAVPQTSAAIATLEARNTIL